MANPISGADLERSMSLTSLHPPGTNSEDAPNSGLPPWMLLDQVAEIDYHGRENATTAGARTIYGIVKVTFFAARPPLLSHFSVHCPGFSRSDLLGKPRIHHSHSNLALLSVRFACGSKTEYFFYRCQHKQRPALEHLKDVGDYLKSVRFVASVGFLPCDSNGSFVLVALALTLVSRQYELHVFRSEQSAWSSKVIRLGGPKKLGHIEKVMALGNQLAFADLWNGILVCDALEEDLMVRFISFPQMLDGNLAKDQTGSARLFRDVTCINGVFRLVEIEHVFSEMSHKCTVIEKKDLSLNDVFYDRELTSYEDTTEEGISEYRGWKVLVWTRTASSSLCWYKEETFRMDQIHIDNCYVRLLDDLGGFKFFFTAVPTLTQDWTNNLYFLAKTRSGLSCVIVVDMKQRTLEELRVLMQHPNLFNPTYTPSLMSQYLSTDSDGIPIDEQNGLNSSYTEPYEDGSDYANLCTEAINNNYPKAILYNGYHEISPSTPSGTFLSSYHQQQQKTINESGSSCVTSSTYRSSSPHTPFSYTNHQQQQVVGGLPVSWSGSSRQPTEESNRSWITSSDDHSPGVQNYNSYCDSPPFTPSDVISFYGMHQKQREFACTWRQSASPLLSSSSNDDGNVVDNQSPIPPSDTHRWQQPPLVPWSNPYLQKRHAHAGACLLKGTSRFAGREGS